MNRLRVLIAPNAFKECLRATPVATHIAEGVVRVVSNAIVDIAPLADGGDGTVEALVEATRGEYRHARVCGPRGAPVEARYGVLGDGETVVIEMATASGLALLPVDQRDPRHTTTRGTGELIQLALENGASKILVGIGGSATNDGGAGMAQALGFSLRDVDDKELPPGGAALRRLARIDASNRHRRLPQVEIVVACDVDNPLCGERGASRIYGPQKGATPAMVEELDAALAHYATIVQRDLRCDVADQAGAGAAGGMGAGLMAFAGARIQPGFDIVAAASNLRERIMAADLVITGEGALDGQSGFGKAPAGVARLARECGVPVVAVAGTLGPGYDCLYREGIAGAYSICPGPLSLADAIATAPALLANIAESIVRTFLAGRAGKSEC